MTDSGNTFHALVELIRRRAPEYVDLLTARTDDEFERAFEAVMQVAVAHLESNKKHYVKLDEEGLTSVLAAAIVIPGLSVTQETHSNGHVDLTIELKHSVPTLKKLGEAKIYNGPQYHIDGLVQLLERYTTGREGRGLLLVYVRKPDIAALVRKLRDRFDADHPCRQQGSCSDHTLKWSFISTHQHDSGENMEVSHIGCNLCTD